MSSLVYKSANRNANIPEGGPYFRKVNQSIIKGIFASVLMLTGAAAWAQLPSDFPGLRLWLRADTGITLYNDNQLVGNWADLSGNNNHVFTEFGSLFLMPAYVPNALNGYPALRFDGDTDYLLFPEITDVRTVFWLAREDADAGSSVQRCLLGHTTQFNFLRGPGKTIWHPLVTENVLNGTTRVNFSSVSPTTTTLPDDYFLLSLVTTGNASASAITRDRNIFTNIWKGDFVELIIYNQPLDQAQVLAVENYLASRYSPAFSPIPDVVVEYGFCDTTVCAPEGFAAYAWNGQPGEACLSIDEPGTYLLEVTDRFGRMLSDTIEVVFPGDMAAGDYLFCSDEGYAWDTGLDSDHYTFLWSTGSLEPAETFEAPGTASVLVTDTTGCSLTATRVLEMDTFPAVATLGPDVQLCAGNTLSLDAPGYTLSTIVWNTGAETALLPIEESGTYWATAYDTNGCMATDTVEVDVVGIAPEIAVSGNQGCAGTPLAFSGELIAGSAISEWSWVVEGNVFAGQNLAYTYGSAGQYPFTLSALDENGCASTISVLAAVYANPESIISYQAGCTNQASVFNSLSVPGDAGIVETNWTFPGSSSTVTDPTVLLSTPGFNEIALTVTDALGCTATSVASVFINAAPETDFTFDGSCEGALTFFEQQVDDLLSGPITTYQWAFGDGTGSLAQNPSHFYPDPGVYDVQLVAVASTGCRDTLIKEVAVLPEPSVDFLLANACVGQPYQVQDFSDAPGDQIVSWSWTVDGGAPITESEPSFIFSETGWHTVSLLISTAAGCEGQTSQMISAWPLPSPAFTFNPPVGLPPLAVAFDNLSAGATSYQWEFGNGEGSSAFEPAYTYMDTGQFAITLVATNAYGCSASFQDQILIDLPVLDLVVPVINSTWTPAGWSAGLTVVNNGNVPVNGIRFSWRKGNGSWVSESATAALQPGESMPYAFLSAQAPAASDFEFICVRADAISSPWVERSPLDNERCEPVEPELFRIFPPYATTPENLRVDLISPAEGTLYIKVCDRTGRVLWEREGSFASGFIRLDIPVSEWGTGIYLVQVSHGPYEGAVRFFQAP